MLIEKWEYLYIKWLREHGTGRTLEIEGNTLRRKHLEEMMNRPFGRGATPLGRVWIMSR